MPFLPSVQQQAVFDFVAHGSGNAIVEAVAGAGKTTTIVEACKLMEGNILLAAFNTKMAKELKERTADMPRVEAATFHAFGFRALRGAYGKRHKLVVAKGNNGKTMEYCRELETFDPANRDYTATICKLVSMAKLRGIGSLTPVNNLAAWENIIETYDILNDLPDGCTVENLISKSQIVLTKSNENLDLIDFDDMVYLPLVKNLNLVKFDWVLIDEAQDTNPTRRALAERMLKDGGRLIAVGDPRQAIFGFTGADNDSLDQIRTAFGCVTLPLSITYRCPKAIVAHARQWVEHITAGDTAPDGSVTACDYLELITRATAGDAILCRYNKPLVQTCFKLIREGKAARIEGRSIGDGLVKLAGKWKVKTLDALSDRLETYMNREIEKNMQKNKEDVADRIKDQCETLFVLIDRAESQGMTTVAELRGLIESMFADNVSESRGMITLCSVHKAKGLEWNRVYILGRDSLMPSKFARQDWQIQQEINLIYVAVTRAKAELIEATAPPSNGKRNHERSLANV